MAMFAQCGSCGREYKVRSDRAGTTLQCKDCGADFKVPRKKGGNSKSSTGSSRMSAGMGLGVALLVGLVFVGKVVKNKAPRILSAVSRATRNSGDDDSQAVQPPQAGQQNVAFRQSVQSPLSNNVKSRHDQMIERFGANNIVTIKFHGVTGDPARAKRYLHRKVFRVSHKYHEAGRQVAANQTQKNKEIAEKKAIEEFKRQNSEKLFFTQWVYYRYRRVDSKVPYPVIDFVGQEGSTYTYRVAPAPNPREFGDSLGIGSASVANRNIDIQTVLPSPIPDPDVEELYAEHGEKYVIKVRITGCHGQPSAVRHFLVTEAMKTNALGRLSVAGLEQTESDVYEFQAGAIHDVELFAENFSCADLVEFDPQTRVLLMKADFPDPFPTKWELKEAEEAERERMEVKREADRKEKKAIWDADFQKKPRPGESELDWAVRMITEKDIRGIPKALDALAVMEVDLERREEVSRLLCSKLGEHLYDIEKLLPAMLQWKTEETEPAVLKLGGKHRASWDNPPIMDALVKLGTPVCAEALASGLADWHSGDDTVRFLIEFGPKAEEAVLKYIKHKDARVRGRVYAVLMDIGGQESLTPLRSNVRLEQDDRMKSTAQDCYDLVKERVKKAEEEQAGEETSMNTLPNL